MNSHQHELPREQRRILVLCPYPFGVAGGQRLKFEQYYHDWQRLGWQVDVSPFMSPLLWSVAFRQGQSTTKIAGAALGLARRVRDMFRIRSYDLVYCFMYVTPLGSSFFERLTRALARRLVFDLEDNVLAGQALKGELPNPLLRLLKNTRKARYMIKRADHVVTSSPFLEEKCLAINEKRACTYISSSVDTKRFIPAERHHENAPLTIGWTGTFSSSVYLDLLRPVFVELARRRRFRLRVIGNFDYRIDGVDLEVVQWSAEREVEDLQAIDVGVYPIPVEEWVLGKSALKTIQYMAVGIPCVATDYGTATRIIRDGENGFLVRRNEEWVSVLERLLDDPQLRRRIGQCARTDAVERYSTYAIARDYRRVLSSVMSDACAG